MEMLVIFHLQFLVQPHFLVGIIVIIQDTMLGTHLHTIGNLWPIHKKIIKQKHQMERLYKEIGHKLSWEKPQ